MRRVRIPHPTVTRPLTQPAVAILGIINDLSERFRPDERYQQQRQSEHLTREDADLPEVEHEWEQHSREPRAVRRPVRYRDGMEGLVSHDSGCMGNGECIKDRSGRVYNYNAQSWSDY